LQKKQRPILKQISQKHHTHNDDQLNNNQKLTPASQLTEELLLDLLVAKVGLYL
jgi:hypothetical protein